MNLDVKPHLKEANELYRRICDFESAVDLKYVYTPAEGARHYKGEDINTVVNAFSEHLQVRQEELESVRDAMLSGEMDFATLVSHAEEISVEGFPLLFIISRPFFKSMNASVHEDNAYLRKGRCPVCSAAPSLSVIEQESQRKYVCSYCGSPGRYTRTGCPVCLTEDARNITVISLEAEEDMKADACDTCKSYFKRFEGGMDTIPSLDELDLLSLPLDIVLQEKGYRRRSPNPVGMIRME